MEEAFSYNACLPDDDWHKAPCDLCQKEFMWCGWGYRNCLHCPGVHKPGTKYPVYRAMPYPFLNDQHNKLLAEMSENGYYWWWSFSERKFCFDKRQIVDVAEWTIFVLFSHREINYYNSWEEKIPDQEKQTKLTLHVNIAHGASKEEALLSVCSQSGIRVNRSRSH